jgi:DNA-binding transcriptional regulator YdaS (Cro superfamily)
MNGLPLDLPEDTPPALSKSAFAALLGVTPARVSQMVAMGMPMRAVDGLIPVEEARAWYAANVRHRASPDEAGARSQARAERDVHEAELARLKVEERTGRLIAKDDVRAAAFERARMERDAHIGFAARVSAVLAGELGCDAARAFAILDREMREHLERLADTPLEPAP